MCGAEVVEVSMCGGEVVDFYPTRSTAERVGGLYFIKFYNNLRDL